MGDGADADVGQPCQPLGQQAQDDTLAGAGVAVDQGETALADLRMLDTPAELLDARRHKQRRSRHVGRERIELEPVEGEQCLVHAGS